MGQQVIKGRQLDLELHNPKVMVTDVNIQGVSKKALSDLPSISRGLSIPDHQINWWLGMLASLKMRFFGTPCSICDRCKKHLY